MSAAEQVTSPPEALSLGGRPVDQIPLAFLDFETTGLSAASGDRVCEVAVLRVEPGRSRPRKLSELVHPGMDMPPLAQSIHGISDAMLADAPPFEDVLPRLAGLLDGAAVLAHNAAFDVGFLQSECHRAGVPVPEHGPVICTLHLARNLFGLNKCSLAALAQRFEIRQPNAHRALADCRTTRDVFAHMVDALTPADGAAPTADGLVERGQLLRKGGKGRRAMERQLAIAAAHGQPISIDYTARHGHGRLVNRRTITVKGLRLPYIDALCHLRGDDRVFHMRRVLHIDDPHGGPAA